MTSLPPGTSLFETMLARGGQGIRVLERHLLRLRASASKLGFAYDEEALRILLSTHCSGLEAGVEYRVRLALDVDGSGHCLVAPLTPLTSQPVILLIAAEHGHGVRFSGDERLRHKTTAREDYDRAWRQAERLGAFDMLFTNERGEVTEGGRTNVFARFGSRWLTPPLASGLLPGVMRAVLLDDPAWQAAEQTLRLDEVAAADELIVCNALRGAMPAKMIRRET